jgi:hypothetical protein
MQFVNEAIVYFNNTTQYIKELLNTVYVEHPNAYLHVLITMLFTMMIIVNMHIKLTNKRLNEMDKRYTVLLLSIQKYCTSLNRAVNEFLEKSNNNMQNNIDNNTKILSLIRIAHQRVKDVYTGLFKHLDIKKIKRAPIAGKRTDEHNELLRKAIDEMIVTDFSSNN